MRKKMSLLFSIKSLLMTYICVIVVGVSVSCCYGLLIAGWGGWWEKGTGIGDNWFHETIHMGQAFRDMG